MSFEFLSVNYLVPQRLYSVVATAAMFDNLLRNDFLALLQPSSLLEKASAREPSDRLVRAAVRCGLLSETEGKLRKVRLAVGTDRVQNIDAFRLLMQERILGVIAEGEDHFIMNQVAAWFACQDERVLTLTKAEFERQFNDQLYRGATERQFSEHPGVITWIAWADFLGWGWSSPFGSVSNVRLAPDATLRVRPHLAQAIPTADKIVSFAEFMNRLSALCPELDGGVLFKECWRASRGSDLRANRISLMLSTALRTLHMLGDIELLDQPDASEMWTLFPAQSHIARVSHIRRKPVL